MFLTIDVALSYQNRQFLFYIPANPWYPKNLTFLSSVFLYPLTSVTVAPPLIPPRNLDPLTLVPVGIHNSARNLSHHRLQTRMDTGVSEI